MRRSRTLLIICAITLALLAALELGLRALGVGAPEPFYIAHPEDPALLLPNDRFAAQYFQTQWQPMAHPHVLARTKPAGTQRIFLFGESAAYGYPDSCFSVARILDELLRQYDPGTRYEIVNVAMSGIDSNVCVEIAGEVAQYDPDAFITYIGNNEYIGPFGPMSRPYWRWTNTVGGALWRHSRIAKLMRALAQVQPKESVPTADAPTWAPAPRDTMDSVRVATRYQHNLGRILGYAGQANARGVVANVVTNIAMAPLNADGDYTSGPVAHWREGRKAVEQGDIENAHWLLWSALNEDALPIRADMSINSHGNTLRLENTRHLQTALALGSCSWPPCFSLVVNKDSTTVQRTAAANLSPLFFDHCHFTFDGAAQLAHWLASAVRARDHDVLPPLDVPALQRALGYSPEQERRGIAYNLVAQARWPFNQRVDYGEWKARWEAELARVNAAITPAQLQPYIDAQEARLERGEWETHRNLAQMFEALGDDARAVEHWRAAAEHPAQPLEAQVELGRTLLRTGAAEAAIAQLATATQRQPWKADYQRDYARALAKVDPRRDEAVAAYEAAIVLAPKDVLLYYELAQLQLALGRPGAAAQAARAGLAQAPQEKGLYYQLGRALEVQECFTAAAAAYGKASALDPAHAGLAEATQRAAARSADDARDCGAAVVP